MDARSWRRGSPSSESRSTQPALIESAPDDKRGRRYFDLVFDAAGLSPSPERTPRWTSCAPITPQSISGKSFRRTSLPALERLRRLGLQLAVVSNANGTLCAKFERLGLAQCVDCVIDSAEVGIEKPDARGSSNARSIGSAHAARARCTSATSTTSTSSAPARPGFAAMLLESSEPVRGLSVRARQLAGRFVERSLQG